MSIVEESLQRAVNEIKYEYRNLDRCIKREQERIRTSQDKIDDTKVRLEEMIVELKEILQSADTLGIKLDVSV